MTLTITKEEIGQDRGVEEHFANTSLNWVSVRTLDLEALDVFSNSRLKA
jgi:hypothetical protein